jgi:hypothetical protein
MEFEDDLSLTTTPEQAAAELRGETTSPAETPAPKTTPEPKAEPAQSEFEKRAAEVEAELEAGTLGEKKEEVPKEGAEEKPATEEPATPTKPAESASARDARLQKIIDTKFGGNEEAFVASLYEQQNSAARLHEELQELKQSLAPKPDLTKPPTPEEHPDLGWIHDEITALTAEATQNRARQDQLVADGRTKREEILQLKGEIRRADEFDQKQLKVDISQAEAALNQMSAEWRDLESRNRRLTSEHKDFNRRKEFAEREVLAAREVQANQAREDQEAQAKEFSKFETTIETVAKEYGITDSDVVEDMYETARAKAALHVRVNGPVKDLSALTRALCEKYLKVHQLGKKTDFAAVSREKTQAARTTNSTAPPKAPANPAPVTAPSRAAESKWTPDFVRLRASRILGG